MLILFILSISCARYTIYSDALVNENLVFKPESYSNTKYGAPPGTDFITITFTIINNSENGIEIDFDDLNLIDSQNNIHRVEFVQGARDNTNGKIFLMIGGNERINKKISFLIDENYSVNGLLYKNTRIELNI